MTTIATIVKANATTITTACGIVVESTSKGVPGQFDKLIGLINQAPEDKDLIIEASLLKGVFKALGEDSKDASTFKCVLSLKGWSLMQVADDWTIYRGNGTGIVLTKNTYNWETQEEVEEMVDYSHEYVPTRWEQVVADELGVEPSKLPEPVYPVVPYTGPVVLPTVIQLGVVYSTLNVDTDQGTKICKFLYTPTGVVTCKGNHFESVEALINAVQAAFKLETQEVSETTQEDIIVKPKTFCQLLRETWLLSKEEWQIASLKNKMRTTWISGKYPTDARQGEFMKRFFEKLAVYSEDTVLPVHAFISTYDLVKEELTGSKIQPEQKPFVSSMTPEEAAANFEGGHKVEIVTQTITKKFEPIPLPAHLKKCGEVRELPKVDTRSYAETLQDMAEKSVFTLINEDWDMTDLKNLESICETYQGEPENDFHVNVILMWIDSQKEKTQGVIVDTKEKPCDDAVELSEGKVVIKTMLGESYTLDVFFNEDKTLWINTKSGESFKALFDLCMVQEKEYKDHQLFVNNEVVGGV